MDRLKNTSKGYLDRQNNTSTNTWIDKTTPAQILRKTKQHQHKYLDRQNNTSTNTYIDKTTPAQIPR
jgi:hypothetical protein